MPVANVAATGDHVTVPVYWSVSVIVVTGVASATGTVTSGMTAISITAAGTVTVKVLLVDRLAGSNADGLAWMVTSPAAEVPVKATVISVALTKDTVSRVRPVVPTPTVKSAVVMPALKFVPVTVTDGAVAPLAMVLVVVITGAASVTVTR